MKTTSKALLLCLTPLLLIGCASGGSDITSIHNTRGRPEAQISVAQADQYKRQLQTERYEREQGQKNVHDFIDSFKEGMRTVQEVRRTFGF